MAKLPIGIQKIKTKGFNQNEIVQYLFSINDKGSVFNQSMICDRNELIRLRNEIDEILKDSTTTELLQITEAQAAIVDQALATDPLCANCKYKLSKHCVTCLLELQSPLERKLYLALNENYIRFTPQYALDWSGTPISIVGKSYHHPTNNFKNVLTIVDFFIEKRDVKLCVYTDGHSYHERTEEQAQRDRNIDRKLQELGFGVLRYTGKEVNTNIERIIHEINSWLDKRH